MKSLISIIALIGLASCSLTIGAKDGDLDPGQITWSKENWVQNAIELSQTNAGTQDITLTFYFRPSTSITDGILQITFPSGLMSAQTVTVNMDLVANTDTSAKVTLVDLPSTAAVYGPFSLVTRSSSTGQIYDANYVFGCIATSALVTASNSLTVTTVSGASSPVVSTTDGVYFAFTITKNLWANDVIEIIPDSHWTPSTSLSCSSETVSATVTNLLFGPDGTHSLPCSRSSDYSTSGDTSIYIYGISEDVFLTGTSLSIKLKVSTFTLPGASYNSATFSGWQVNIWRRGTNTLLAQYTASSGPVSVAAGTVTFGSWAPVNSLISASDVVSGMNIFTKVTFTTAHSIPQNGVVVLTFANVDITAGKWFDELDASTSGNTAYCYITPYIEDATCSVSSSTVVTITFANIDGQDAGSISIVLLPTFSASAKISSIVSKTASAGTTIDTTSATLSASWTLAASTKMTMFKFFAYDGLIHPDTTSGTLASGKLAGGYVASSARYLWFFLTPGTSAWTTSTALTVSLSFSTSGIQYTQPYIASSTTKYDLEIATTATTTASLRTLVNPISATAITLGSNSISVTPPAVAIGESYAFAFGGASDNSIAYPFVASNLGTWYESFAKSTTTVVSTTTTHIASWVYTVTLKSVAATVISALPLCLNNYAGIPLVSRFKANLMDIDFTSSSYSYAIDITLASETDLGTGLTGTDDDLPVSSTASGAAATIDATGGVVTLTGLGSVSTSSASFVTTYIPKGVLTTVGVSATSLLYYTLSSDPDLKFKLYQHAAETATVTPTAVAWAAAASQAGTLYTGTSGTITGTLKATAASAVDSIVGVGLPTGFTAASSTLTAGSTPSVYYRTSSPAHDFDGSFILGVATASYLIATTSTSLAVAGVVPPARTAGTSGDAITVSWFASSATPGSACTHAESVATGATLNPATIATPTLSPSSVGARSADSVTTTVSIGFTTINPIPLDTGVIVINLDSDWSYPSTCTASGVSDGTNPLSCAIATNTVTVSSFAAVSAGASITVEIYPVLPPTATGTNAHISAIYTRISSAGNYIDMATTGLSNTVTVTDASSVTAGTTSSITADAFPNQAGMTSDIYLSFALSKAVPVGGTVAISAGFSSWIYSSGTIQDYCWSNIDYAACSLSSSKVTLTLGSDLAAGETVMLYLNKALVLPSSAGATSLGFMITSAYSSVTVTTDVSPGSVFTVGAAITAAVTVTDITVDVDNAAELASYDFSFTSAAALEVGDYFVVQFPREYDPYLGVAVNKLTECEQDTFFIDCDSETLGNIDCHADHWYLLIDELDKTDDADSALDFTVYNIKNPRAGSVGAFAIYHFDSDDNVKAFDDSVALTTIPAIATSGLTVKSIEIVDEELSAISEYTFDFYVAGVLDSDSAIFITFPQQYNLQLTLGSSTTSCSTVYYDESNASGTDPTEKLTWNAATSCTVGDQWIALEIPTATTETFVSTDRISITLSSVPNPQWGLTRDVDSDWDTMDSTTFGEHDVWTDRFEVAVVDSVTASVTNKSYGVLNSAYLGFTNSYTSIDVGSYDPQTDGSRVNLMAGTQSGDITISVGTWPLKSKSLVLKPSSNGNFPDSGNLEYTSVYYDWTVWQMVDSLTFRVAASASISKGLYYIDWTTTEVLQEGIQDSLYSAPLSILVEVCAESSSSVAVSVATIPTLYKGFTSIPISVSLANAPATDMTVTLAFGATSTKISTTPASLTFGPDSEELYFEIVVDSAYDSTQASPVLTFTLSGTDSAVYSAPATKTITVSSTTSSASLATVSLASTVRSGSEVTVTASTAQNGVLYWYLSCQGTVLPSFAELVAMVADPVSPANGTMTLWEQLAEEYQSTETDMDDSLDATMTDFFRRKQQEHCAKAYSDAEVVYANQALTLDLDFLSAGTPYTLIAYVDNRLSATTSTIANTTITFTTTSLSGVYTQAVTFSGSVASTVGDNIRYSLAKNMGVNPSWLDGQAVTTTTSRMLQTVATTTFTYNVLYDRKNPAYNPSTILNNLDRTLATSELTTIAGSAPTYVTAAVSTGSTPSWVAAPASSSVSESTATFIATSTQAGEICVSCATTDVSGITYAWEVLVGLDAESNVAFGSCADSTASTNTTLTVTGLASGTAYNCYFTACNSYPLWPSCIDATATTSLAKVSITTDTVVTSSAMIMSIFAVFFLIFN